MGFKTGKHGKVYNDSKSTKGSGSDSPGNHDGSHMIGRENFPIGDIDDVDKQMDLEFPVVKWNHGEEYAVLHNNSEIELMNHPVNELPKHVSFLKEFKSKEEALDYQEFRMAKEYGGIGLINNKEFEADAKKYGEST